ncbi:hypothetical protein B7494_g6223 [Chlorociboria aeruginascens]|nr:hypothetical protein B7494_g6223 [Chlorociboria aeruginascens]
MATAKISTSVFIDAPPNVVRSKFLDFPSIPLYHRSASLMESLTPPAGKRGIDLEPGDRIKHQIRRGITFTPTVTQNDQTTFGWQGIWPFSWIPLFSGRKRFQFLPSANGGTLFVQEEEWNGILGLVMAFRFAREQVILIFSEFNKDLRKWCEER